MLSYPYLFKYDTKLYMCPETSQNNDIRIYECEIFPLKWKLKNIIMTNAIIMSLKINIFMGDFTPLFILY